MKRFVPLVLAACAASVSAEDCAQCADKPCLTHEATDDLACKEASIKFKTKDMIGKREAINGLADAQRKHMNLRSRKITTELLKGLADPDVDVKLLAAEVIAEMGEPSLAVQGLSMQVAAYKKMIGGSKPKKEAELPKWEANFKMLGLMYDSLAKTKAPGAIKIFEEDIAESSPWICQAAAGAVAPLKGEGRVIKALYEGVNKWLGPSTKAPVPEGYTEAFFAMSRGLEAVVEEVPKFKGNDQNGHASTWRDWWGKVGEAKYGALK